MRRLRSALVIGAVALVAVVAAVDGIRGGEREPRAPKPRADAGHVASTAESVSGTLVYLDRQCRLHRIALPSGADSNAPRQVACGLTLDPTGRLAKTDETWQPGGALSARCIDGHVDRTCAGGEPILRRRGCSPAWKPDGSLTYVVDGSLRLSSRPPRSAALLSAGDVSRAVGLARATIGPTRLREVAWLDDQRFAALLTTNKPPGPGGTRPPGRLRCATTRARSDVFGTPPLGSRREPSGRSPRGSDGTRPTGGAHLFRPKRSPVQPLVRERPCDRLVTRRALGYRGHAAEHPPLPDDGAIPARPPVRDRRDRCRLGALTYKGMLPCLRGGRRSRLVSAVASASQRIGRLRLGSITSST